MHLHHLKSEVGVNNISFPTSHTTKRFSIAKARRLTLFVKHNNCVGQRQKFLLHKAEGKSHCAELNG
jgi:hypothetical protein